jgi:hypothetical protein
MPSLRCACATPKVAADHDPVNNVSPAIDFLPDHDERGGGPGADCAWPTFSNGNRLTTEDSGLPSGQDRGVRGAPGRHLLAVAPLLKSMVICWCQCSPAAVPLQSRGGSGVTGLVGTSWGSATKWLLTDVEVPRGTVGEPPSKGDFSTGRCEFAVSQVG